MWGFCSFLYPTSSPYLLYLQKWICYCLLLISHWPHVETDVVVRSPAWLVKYKFKLATFFEEPILTRICSPILHPHTVPMLMCYLGWIISYIVASMYDPLLPARKNLSRMFFFHAVSRYKTIQFYKRTSRYL